MKKEMWIAGKITNVLSDGWDFLGVFEDKELALKGLKEAFDADMFSDPDKYFIAPSDLNKIIICEDGQDWEDGYFPFSKDNKG